MYFADAETEAGVHQPQAVSIYNQLMDFRSFVMLALYLPVLRALNDGVKALQRTDGYVLDDVKVRSLTELVLGLVCRSWSFKLFQRCCNLSSDHG